MFFLKILGGAIICSRQIIESEIFTNKPHSWLKIWLYFIIKANYKNKKLFKKGTFFTKYNWIQEACRVKKNEIDRCLQFLKKNKMCTTQKKRRGLIIIILKYNKYQNLQNYFNTAETQTNEKANKDNDFKEKKTSSAETQQKHSRYTADTMNNNKDNKDNKDKKKDFKDKDKDKAINAIQEKKQIIQQKKQGKLLNNEKISIVKAYKNKSKGPIDSKVKGLIKKILDKKSKKG